LKPCSEYGINSYPTSCTSTEPHVNFCVIGLEIYSLDKNNVCRSGFGSVSRRSPSFDHYLSLENNKLNAVRIDGTSKIDIDTATTDIADIQNYILVHCDQGVCKQTQGYININSAVNAFVGTKSGSSANEFFTITSNPEDIGKVFIDVNYYGITVKSRAVVALANNVNPLIISGATTGPFEDSDGVPLKITGKYVIKDMFTSGGMNLIVSN